MLVKDFRALEFGLALNGLNSLIEGQGVYIRHHLGSLKTNSKCYKYTTKTMKAFQNFANKKVPNAPNTLGVTIILVTKIFQDMSSKSKHKKFNIISLKKVEIGRSLNT